MSIRFIIQFGLLVICILFPFPLRADEQAVANAKLLLADNPHRDAFSIDRNGRIVHKGTGFTCGPQGIGFPGTILKAVILTPPGSMEHVKCVYFYELGDLSIGAIYLTMSRIPNGSIDANKTLTLLSENIQQSNENNTFVQTIKNIAAPKYQLLDPEMTASYKEQVPLTVGALRNKGGIELRQIYWIGTVNGVLIMAETQSPPSQAKGLESFLESYAATYWAQAMANVAGLSKQGAGDVDERARKMPPFKGLQ